jgi:heme/copper-type cytochrome/quinol oxidase subunit 2
MYCSSCGVAVAQGLPFCNFCGAKLGGAKNETLAKSAEVKPELLVSAMVVVFVFGLVAITMFMGVMKTMLAFDTGQLLAFALLSFLIMLSIEGVFVRLLFRPRRDRAEKPDPVQLRTQATNELDAAHALGLTEHRPSVTEHTTRAFAPIYKDGGAKGA